MIKSRSIKLTFLFLLGAFSVLAMNKTEKIKVNGSCEMCKKRIEKTTNSLDGVENATWNLETRELSVSYDDQKTSTQKIQTSIAMIGHDTDLFGASDTRYAELPGCCQYERDDNRKTNSHASMDLPGLMKNPGSVTECVHDKSPTSGSCCDKQ